MLEDIKEQAKMIQEDCQSQLKIAEELAKDAKKRGEKFKMNAKIFKALNAGLTILHFWNTSTNIIYKVHSCKNQFFKFISIVIDAPLLTCSLI